MSQTRRDSALEALADVMVGYGLAVGTQLAVFPAFDLALTLPDNLAIGAVFTAVSLARGYLLRRLFERLSRRPA